MKKYFLHNGSEQEGPFDLDELKSKNITRTSKVWYEGLSEWIVADKIEELNDFFVAIPPPLTQKEKDISKSKDVEKSKKYGKRIILFITIVVLSLIGYYAFTMIQQQRQNEDIAFYRSHIMDYVKAERSDYTYYEIGGIKDLSITVTNNTKYLLDKVVVNVKYIKTMGGVWKEETIEFNYLGRYDRRTIKAPDSNRGTEISYEIVSIKSTALGLY